MDLQLATVITTLESSDVGERAHRARIVFPVSLMRRGSTMGPEIGKIIPGRRGDTRDPVLRGNLTLVNGQLGQVAGVFIPFKRMGDYGGDVDLATKVAREITKVSALLDDRAGTK